MKHLKTYENKKSDKYIVSKHDDDYFLDKLVRINEENNLIAVKIIFTFDTKNNKNLYYYNDEVSELYLDSYNILFSSDDYIESRKYYMKIVEMYIDSNKYNL